MQTLWLIRHAQRLDFVRPEWFETAIYPYDPPLSAQGVEYSQTLANKLSQKPIDLIFTSPFLRTIQTAAPLSRLLELSIHLEWGLCEWLCREWTSALPETLPINLLKLYYPNIDSTYRSVLLPCYPETYADMNSRSNNIADKLVQNNTNRSILAIGHKVSLLAIVATLTGDRRWQSYPLACGEAIELTRSDTYWHSKIVEW